MPMRLLTIIQFGSALGAYSLMVLALPAMLFGNKLRGYRLMARFFIYITIGNFYMMNLVFALQLLHISNRATLIAGTFLPAAAVLFKFRAFSVWEVLKTQSIYIVRFTQGRVGARTLAGTVFGWVGRRIRAAGRWIMFQMKQSSLEWIAVLTVILLLCWQYGKNLLENFGYCASDIIVHNYWINEMGQGEIFVAGIYPFGFHCVIYYLHMVFGIDTYVLLRLFCFVQVLYIHMALLAFIRLCCKARYSVYLGVILYVIGGFFAKNIYSRFYSSLPQEFGILFILPAVWFLLDFLNIKREEVKKNSRTLIDLTCFALSFSMTLAVHFYGTMIAGLFCVAVAAAYLPVIFRKEYFWRILAAGILSIVLAVLPMGVAFIGGTPLQGSLNWGLNVITGGDKKEEAESGEEGADGEAGTQDTDDEAGAQDVDGGAGTQDSDSEAGAENVEGAPEAGGREETGLASGTEGPAEMEAEHGIQDKSEEDYRPEAAEWPADRRGNGIRSRIKELLRAPFAKLEHKKDQMRYAMIDNVFRGSPETMASLVMGIIFLLLGTGLVYTVFLRGDYGRRLIASGIFLLMLVALLAARRLGLPALMDANRCGVYLGYMLPILWALGLDSVLTFLFGWYWKGRLADWASLVVLAVLIPGMLRNGWYREPLLA